MQQTLLALAAVFSFSLYALGRHQTDNGVERRAVAAEVERAAGELAETRMAELLDQAWDEATAHDEAALLLTPPPSTLGPDPGETPATYDDLDDFRTPGGLAGTPTTRPFAIASGHLAFHVWVDVVFVKGTVGGGGGHVVESLAPTLAKEVRVRVREANGPPGRPPAEATLRRVVTPVRL